MVRRARQHRLATALLTLAALALGAGPAVAAPGDLDTSFAAPNGFVLTSIGGANINGKQVLIDPSGRIVVAANEFVGGSPLLGLVRYLPGGSLDSSFDAGSANPGTIFTGITGMTATVGQAMAAQSDGAILVGGYADDGTSKVFALARFTAAGKLDASFNPTGTPPGTVTSNILGSTDERISGVGILSSGKIAVVGSDQNGTLEYMRYATNGTVDLDPVPDTFTGVSGIQPTSMVVAPGDKVLVGGYATVGAVDELIVARLKDDGTPDTTFGSGGIRTFGVGSPTDGDRAGGIALQPDGSVVIAGTADFNTGASRFAVARLTPAGGLDPSFGSGGVTLLAPSSLNNTASAVALQPNGKLVVGGTANVVGDGTGDFTVARLGANGAPDPSFGAGGETVRSLVPGGDLVSGVALQADGGIVAAGLGLTSTSGDVAVARFLGGELPAQSPPVALDTTKPKISRLRLLARRLRAIRKARALRVRVHMSEAGSLTIRVKIGVRRRHHRVHTFVIAHRTVRFKAAATRTFKIKLSRAARSRLGGLRKPRIRLVATAKDLAGNKAKKRSLTVRLKRG